MAQITHREIGVHAPSFADAMRSAGRENADVILVGELRGAETMRMALQSASFGILVFATVHSSSSAEALQRVVNSFPPEVQAGVCAQLADCLVGVITQRLRFREDLGIRVPELEVMMASTPVKALVRSGQFFKLQSAIDQCERQP